MPGRCGKLSPKEKIADIFHIKEMPWLLFLTSCAVLSGGCNSRNRFVHVGERNPYLMFDNYTAQNCWAGANLPTCQSLADGTYVKVSDSHAKDTATSIEKPAETVPTCPTGIPSGSKAETVSSEELVRIVGKVADFNGTYVKYGLQNDTHECITAFVATFEFQTKSGGTLTISTTEQISETLSPGWSSNGNNFYVLKNFEKQYPLTDSRSENNGRIDYENPRFPIALISWRVSKAWGFVLPHSG
jgi:hypothetical protein